MSRKTVTTELRGDQCGLVFDDRSNIKDINKDTIHSIRVEHSYQVYSLTISYGPNVAGVKHGKTKGTVSEIVLDPGEFIVTVKGRENLDEYSLCHLSFTSNKGRAWGPYGTVTTGEEFIWNGSSMVSSSSVNMGLLYFSGSFSSWLSHLQATFAEHLFTGNPPGGVMYEKRTLEKNTPGASTVLSKFARNIMSSVIELQVGPNSIIFYAYKDIICRLPFFQAALNGQFTEASEKTVKMPEDEPEIVSALLEFLYVGKYTYTYDPESNSTEGIPVHDISEGSFHIRLYSLASKYDCQPLAELARRSVAYVFEGLQTIQAIHLLKEMYENSWILRDWEDDTDMRVVKQGLPKLIKQLYVSQKDELESILADCPVLAIDLLRLVALS